MTHRLNQLRNHPIIKKHVIPVLKPFVQMLRQIKARFFLHFWHIVGLLPSFYPQWLKRAFPAIEETRELLGKEAYAHLISIAFTTRPYRKAMQEMAFFLCNTGLPDAGIALYSALINDYNDTETPPHALINIYLQTLMFGSPEVQTNDHIYKEHVRWSKRFISDKRYTTYSNPLTSNRRLKIGYTCSFLTNSTSKTLLQPLLLAHHPERVEVYIYSDEPPSSLSESLKNIYSNWRDTYHMDADSFCELVRKDEIDILLELNGHILTNRYHEITRHPAPVQVAWYNYANTTGVQGMDYSLTSDDINIDQLQPYYSETIIRKSGSSHAIPVGNHFPPVSAPAFEKNGYITFCSFGQALKVSKKQILLWCEVLKRVPGSKFFMKAQMLGEEPAKRAAFIKHFKDGGIDESRLIMEGNSDYPTLLKCYERVDIALDTYPHNAGTTSIESIIQGVPVISLTGMRYSSKLSCAIVGTGGHTEFQCQSPEEFIEKAVALANDSEQLKQYRQNLRADYLRSPRVNVDGFMSELEDTFFKMWHLYVASTVSNQSSLNII